MDPALFADTGGYGGVVFNSPSKKIYCRIAEGEYSSGCQSGTAPVPVGANCTNPTFTVDQLSKGFFLMPDKVVPTCFNQGVFGSEFPHTLQYNESISWNGFTCTSRESGMFCATSNGHGFELSDEIATWY